MMTARAACGSAPAPGCSISTARRKPSHGCITMRAARKACRSARSSRCCVTARARCGQAAPAGWRAASTIAAASPAWSCRSAAAIRPRSPACCRTVPGGCGSAHTGPGRLRHRCRGWPACQGCRHHVRRGRRAGGNPRHRRGRARDHLALDRRQRDCGTGGPELRPKFIRQDPLVPESLPKNTVSSLYRDRSGLVWVGTVLGLCRYDPANSAVLTLQGDPGRKTGLRLNDAPSVLSRPDGSLWSAPRTTGCKSSILPGGAALPWTCRWCLP